MLPGPAPGSRGSLHVNMKLVYAKHATPLAWETEPGISRTWGQFKILFCVNLQQYLLQEHYMHCSSLIFLKRKRILGIFILVSKATPGWSSKTKIWLQLALATLLLSLMLALDGGLVRPRGGPHSSPSGSAKHQDRETSKYVLKTGKCFKRFVVHSINNDRVQKV